MLNMQRRAISTKRKLQKDSPLPPLVVRGGEAVPTQYFAFNPPAPQWMRVLLRAWSWMWARIRFGVGNYVDSMRGRASQRRQAVRLREILTSMGGPALVAAQQLAMRLDLLPLEFAAELSGLVDKAKPMSLEYALERIEVAVGEPIEDVFVTIDPKPIVANTIACVYQAILIDGRKVALRVRQPDAAKLLSTESVAISLLIKVVEPFFPRQVSMFRHLRDELPQVLLENLNFRRVARLQRIFRKQAKKAKVKHFTAARVYSKLSGDDVIVSEFISGVWLDEVIAAQENQDEEALAWLASIDIDPKVCARRLMQVGWWLFFENLFFCQMPDPWQIVVRPGNKLVFIDLGDTGLLGWQQRKQLKIALEKLTVHDVEGAVSMLVQLLMPLPPIDVHEFTKRVESRMWTQLFAMENKDASWWERTGTGLWLALLETTQGYGVSVRLEISRMIQASCMYNHMAARLWPRMRTFKEFKRYMRQADKRAARKFVRKMSKNVYKGRMVISRAQQETLLNRVSMWMETAVEDLPLQFIALTKKGAYSTSQTLSALMAAARMALIAATVRAGYVRLTQGFFDLVEALKWTIFHPIFLGVSLVIFVTTARRMLYRLDDVDVDD